MPAYHAFNHAILAVRLPKDVLLPAIAPIYNHPRLGRLLVFDPTNEHVPFGQIPDYEQGNWALLVTPDGGELIQVPHPPPAANCIERTGQYAHSAYGLLLVRPRILGNKSSTVLEEKEPRRAAVPPAQAPPSQTAATPVADTGDQPR
jgi:hypothetical protein